MIKPNEIKGIVYPYTIGENVEIPIGRPNLSEEETAKFKKFIADCREEIGDHPEKFCFLVLANKRPYAIFKTIEEFEERAANEMIEADKNCCDTHYQLWEFD